LLADGIVCVSPSVKKSFRTWERLLINKDVLCIINNGVDLHRIETGKITEWDIQDVAQIDPEATLVGSAGALVEQKGHDVLIDAVDRVNEMDGPVLELVICGDGDRKHELEEQIENASNPERLHLLGFLERREQVYRMMDQVDVYAMPSRWEGLSVAAMEAMALGTPCIFSNIEPFTEQFHDIAFFHSVSNASSLADQLVEIAKNPELSKKLGKRAKSRIRSGYNLQITAGEYINIYELLLNCGDTKSESRLDR
jgi:glycosyltransferase involved in cell wall biosynthesis